MIQQEPREKETCKLGTVEGKTRKGLPIPAGGGCKVFDEVEVRG
jgi:hypothetical protein